MTRCFSFRRGDTSVLVPAAIGDRQAKLLAARAHEVRKLDGKKPGGIKGLLKSWDTLIERKYMRPEPGVHIINIPVWCPLPNDINRCNDARDRRGRNFMWRIHKQKENTREALRNTFFWALPEWALDQTHEAKREGRAQALRQTIKRVYFSRISPGYADPDGAQSSSKMLQDAFAAWYEQGHFFKTEGIGDCDGRVIWNQAKRTGFVEWQGGDQIHAKGYGAQLELHMSAL